MNDLKFQNINQNENRDYSISMARFIAMVFIVVCHIMQRATYKINIFGASIELAWWFNVGVQMFLFISGYLYGLQNQRGEQKLKAASFYSKTFKKILVDYYVFIILILLLSLSIKDLSYIKSEVFGLLTFSKFPIGFGHLWFISTILFCYILTPILLEAIGQIDIKSDIGFCFKLIILLSFLSIIIFIFFKNFNPTYIACYTIGIIYSRFEKRIFRFFISAITIFTISLVFIQLYVEYYSGWNIKDLGIWKVYSDYVHVFLGVTLVILIRLAFSKIKECRVLNLLKWSDKYSYDVYLVHHIFIQSPVACDNYISDKIIATFIAIIMTIVCAMILNCLSKLVKQALLTKQYQILTI